SLPPLSITQAAILSTDRLEVVQTDDRQLWLYPLDALVFDRQPVHVFTLESETDDAPAALILTTHNKPGDPEQHRMTPPERYLHRSRDTMLLAFVPRDQAAHFKQNIGEAEDVIYDTLLDADYGLDVETGTFCICRFNPSMSASYDDPIPVYRIPGGYMLQFNPDYRFTPEEMVGE
ncbi:MAG: hypothetical protein GX573_21845, partial [Chloroflexi bacterium]|nr:hypothetical protein [Chloroflexota bacterium]